MKLRLAVFLLFLCGAVVAGAKHKDHGKPDKPDKPHHYGSPGHRHGHP